MRGAVWDGCAERGRAGRAGERGWGEGSEGRGRPGQGLQQLPRLFDAGGAQPWEVPGSETCAADVCCCA